MGSVLSSVASALSAVAFSKVTLLVVLCLFALYVIVYVRKPVLTFVDNAQNRALVSATPLLQRAFWPTVYLPNQLLQTAASNVYRRAPPGLVYERQLLTLSDGEPASVDWFRYRTAHDKPLDALGCCGAGDGHTNATTAKRVNALPHDAPIALVLHGLAGASDQPNTQHLIELFLSASAAAQAAQTAGRAAPRLSARPNAPATAAVRVCVWNRRGSAPDMPLKHPKPYQWGDASDLVTVLAAIRATFPRAPIAAVGLSAGSNPMCRYMGEQGAASEIACGVSISNCFDVERCANGLTKSRFWDKTMGDSLKEALFARHEALYATTGKVDIEAVRKSVGVKELDRLLMCPLWGYPATDAGVDEYHRVNSSQPVLPNVAVPLLCLNSLDDPIIPDALLPYAVARSNANVILATTYSGGHLGWVDSNHKPLDSATWVERVAAEFVFAFLQTRSVA